MCTAPASAFVSTDGRARLRSGFLYLIAMITWSEIVTITALSVALAAIGTTLVAVVVHALF